MPNALVLDPGLLLGMSYADLQADHVTPQFPRGQYGLVRDAYGPRIMRYMHNMAAAAAATLAGGLYSRAANVAIASSGEGTTTTIETTGLTAGALVGRLAYIRTATVAGAAPEGETGVIVANTATRITIDSRRPFSAPVIATTVVDIYALYDFIAAASGDLNHNVFGIGVATAGVTNANWGVLQQFGYCPDAKCTPAAVLTIAKALIADTERVKVSLTSADNLLIGYAPVVVNATNSGKALVHINVWSPQPLTA